MRKLKCDICEEAIYESPNGFYYRMTEQYPTKYLMIEVAEMYYPRHPERPSVFCHAECGLGENLEIA